MPLTDIFIVLTIDHPDAQSSTIMVYELYVKRWNIMYGICVVNSWKLLGDVYCVGVFAIIILFW